MEEWEERNWMDQEGSGGNRRVGGFSVDPFEVILGVVDGLFQVVDFVGIEVDSPFGGDPDRLGPSYRVASAGVPARRKPPFESPPGNPILAFQG